MNYETNCYFVYQRLYQQYLFFQHSSRAETFAPTPRNIPLIEPAQVPQFIPHSGVCPSPHQCILSSLSSLYNEEVFRKSICLTIALDSLLSIERREVIHSSHLEVLNHSSLHTSKTANTQYRPLRIRDINRDVNEIIR